MQRPGRERERRAGVLPARRHMPARPCGTGGSEAGNPLGAGGGEKGRARAAIQKLPPPPPTPKRVTSVGFFLSVCDLNRAERRLVEEEDPEACWWAFFCCCSFVSLNIQLCAEGASYKATCSTSAAARAAGAISGAAFPGRDGGSAFGSLCLKAASLQCKVNTRSRFVVLSSHAVPEKHSG